MPVSMASRDRGARCTFPFPAHGPMAFDARALAKYTLIGLPPSSLGCFGLNDGGTAESRIIEFYDAYLHPYSRVGAHVIEITCPPVEEVTRGQEQTQGQDR